MDRRLPPVLYSLASQVYRYFIFSYRAWSVDGTLAPRMRLIDAVSSKKVARSPKLALSLRLAVQVAFSLALSLRQEQRDTLSEL